jgi:hypothetical protein
MSSYKASFATTLPPDKVGGSGPQEDGPSVGEGRARGGREDLLRPAAPPGGPPGQPAHPGKLFC